MPARSTDRHDLELVQQSSLGGLRLVQGYGDGGFKLLGRRYAGSILILPGGIQSWPVETFADLSLPSLTPVMEAEPSVELLIIGCGATFSPAPVMLCKVLRSKQIGVEAMDTGAACRTFNVLASEERRVAAALIVLKE